MSEERKDGNENRKNVCRICGKKIFYQGSELAACIKTKYGHSICFPCAYNIEYVLEMTDYDWDVEELEIVNDNVKTYDEKKELDGKDILMENEVKNFKLPDKKIVIQKLQEKIIGQDEHIVRIVGMIYRNFSTKNKELKSSPLIIGKNGHGKTSIVTEFCKLIGVPYVIENAKDFSEAGYVGRDPMEMITDLYKMCGENKEITEQSIIIIDEVDKLRESSGFGRDVSGSGVVQTFFSYLSGVRVPIKDRYDNIIAYIDTTNIKFIFLGAFEDSDEANSLYGIRKKRLNKNILGFNTTTQSEQIIQKHFNSDDLVEYGFSRQFTGRLRIIEINEFTKENLYDIVMKSKLSVYRAYEREFKEYGLEMICNDGLIDDIIQCAMDKKTGARGVKDTCDDAFLAALEKIENMDEIPYTKIIFSSDVIDDPNKYTLE